MKDERLTPRSQIADDAIQQQRGNFFFAHQGPRVRLAFVVDQNHTVGIAFESRTRFSDVVLDEKVYLLL